MKECKAIEPLLSLFVNGELDAGQAASVAQHLKACSHCQHEVNEYQHLAAQLKLMPSLKKQQSFWDHFDDEVAAKTATSQNEIIALLTAISAAVYRRRFAVVASLSFMLIVATALWYQNNPAAVKPNGTLTRLLEQRDWPALYHALRASGAQSKLLDEPVSASLMKSSLIKLITIGKKNRQMRIGMNRLLATVAPATGKSFGRKPSFVVLGVVSTAGYKTVRQNQGSQPSLESLVILLNELPSDKAITLREIFNREV